MKMNQCSEGDLSGFFSKEHTSRYLKQQNIVHVKFIGE